MAGTEIPQIEERLGYVFNDKQLLQLAFIHRSYFNENRAKVPSHNERLEFLGDSVLGLLVSDALYRALPEHAEGQLSHLRAHFVGATSCAALLIKLDLAQFVLLGKGEQTNEGRGRERILADLFEAIIGAVYLDGGLDAAKDFFHTHFGKDLEEATAQPLRNWKAELQDYAQKKYQCLPEYAVLEESGPDHRKCFIVAALIDQREVGRGTGPSKKQAEQAAAHQALTFLEKSHG